jgi:hypothetical protein
MSVNQRSLDEVVLAYIEAWSTPDAALRRELLDMSLADNGSYTDPFYEVRGTEELADLIGRSLSGEAYGGAGAGARRILRGYGLTRRVPPSPPAAVGHAEDVRRPLFPGLLLRLLAQINRRFLLRLAHPYREDNRPGVEGDDPSRFFEHNPPLVHVPEQAKGPSPRGTFARVQGHLLSNPGFQSRDFGHGLLLSSDHLPYFARKAVP